MIYRAFEEYLENRYVTAEDVLEVLAGKLEESELIKNSEVLVDGFTGFTPVQIGVLGKLFRLCAKVYVTIIMDEREMCIRDRIRIVHEIFTPKEKEIIFAEKVVREIDSKKAQGIGAVSYTHLFSLHCQVLHI